MGLGGIILGIGKAIAGALSAGGVTGAIVKSAISIGLSVAAQAVFGKKAPSQKQGRSGNVRSAEAPQEVVLGAVRKGGVMAYINFHGEDNKYLHHVMVVAAHECEAVDTIYVGGKFVVLDPGTNVATNASEDSKLKDFYRGKKYLGTATQTADAELVAEVAGETGPWTTDHRLQGLCYLYSRLRFGVRRYPNGAPPITVKMRGSNQIYDPRTDTTGYSANPALQTAWVLETYSNIPRARIDSASLIEAANICDEIVTNKDASTQKRYTSNGFFELDGEPEEWIEPIIAAMAGALIEHDGTYYIHAGAYRNSVRTIVDDDIVDAGEIVISTAESNLDRANAVHGLFVGDITEGQPTEYPQVSDAAMLAEDGSEHVLNLDLEFCDTHTQAQRVAWIYLKRQRLDERVSIDVALWAGLDVKPWDTVTLQIEALGLTGTWQVVNHEFIVDAQSGPVSWVRLGLKKHDASIYAYDAATLEKDFEGNTLNLAKTDGKPATTLSDNDAIPAVLDADSSEGEVGDVRIDWRFGRAFRKVEVET